MKNQEKNESEKLQRKRKRAKNDAATAIRCLIQWAYDRKAWGIVNALENAHDDVADAARWLQADEELESGAFDTEGE